MLRDSYFICLI